MHRHVVHIDTENLIVSRMRLANFLEILPLVAVEGDEDEEEGGEAPEG